MINIAKLLKDAPKGMKLYSPLFGEVKFKYINGSKFGIVVEDSEECCRSFDKYGRYFTIYNNAECLLFPSKDYRTWQGWTPCVEPNFEVGDWVVRKDGETFYGGNYAEQITLIEVDEKGKRIWLSSTTYVHDDEIHLWTIADAKDGDVLRLGCVIAMFKKYIGQEECICYCSISEDGDFEIPIENGEDNIYGCTNTTPATKEQRDLLFKKMKEAGYQWDDEKKELKKIPKHYDIASFHVGMPVLVRADNVCRWDYSLFSRITGNEGWHFAVCNGVSFTQCIPFEGNEHLLGTTDMCDEQYINW